MSLIDFSEMSGHFWTSGVNFGTLNSSTYGFCSTARLLNSTLWAADQPEEPLANHCVALRIARGDEKRTGLVSVTCELFLPVICQFSY